MASTGTELPSPATAASEGKVSQNKMKAIGVKADNIHYHSRLAVRVIIKNKNSEIIILSAKKDNYYKLPGGGIDVGEDHQTAAQREAVEETGCMIKVVGDCIATVEEYRGDLHQFSYCYYAELVEEMGVTALTDDEIVDGLEYEWVSIERAVEKMRGCEPSTEFGRSIKERDTFLLETWQNERHCWS